jgi:hypothetical protein
MIRKVLVAALMAAIAVGVIPSNASADPISDAVQLVDETADAAYDQVPEPGGPLEGAAQAGRCARTWGLGGAIAGSPGGWAGAAAGALGGLLGCILWNLSGGAPDPDPNP